MPEFSVTPIKRILEIYDIMAPTEWPAQASVVLPGLIQRLDWTMTGDPDHYPDVETDLPVNFRGTSLLTPKGELTQVGFGITDMVPEGGDTSCVKSAYKNIHRELSLTLGKSSGRAGAVWWELPSGGRVHLKRLSRSVYMQFICSQYADVERAEARLGISPTRVLGEDE